MLPQLVLAKEGAAQQVGSHCSREEYREEKRKWGRGGEGILEMGLWDSAEGFLFAVA